MGPLRNSDSLCGEGPVTTEAGGGDQPSPLFCNLTFLLSHGLFYKQYVQLRQAYKTAQGNRTVKRFPKK